MKEYTRFLIADLISQFSSGLLLSTISWVAISRFSSNSLVANLTNANLISGLLITILLVPLIDNLNYRKVIKSSLLVKLAIIVLGTVMYILLNNQILALYVLALANGIGWNMYFPSSKKLIQELSDKESMIKNNAFAETSMQIGLFSSGLASGIILNYFSVEFMLIFISILSFISVLVIYTLKNNIVHQTNTNKINHSIISFIKHNYLFVIFIGIILYIPFIGASEINTILPGYVKDVLNGNSIMYGSIDMMYGLGATLAGLFVSYCSKYFKNNTLLCGLFLFSIFIGIALRFTSLTSFIYIGILILGIIGPSIRIIINSTIMKKISTDFLGTLMSLWNIMNLLIQIFVIRLIGQIMDSNGPAVGFLIYALTMTLGLVIALGFHRNLKES